ncbi:prolactin-releasing peptide receptor-like [Lutzomyia longipalpis]|uniref:prolactin-releasing peptide receptor-like n=1 Tax=Lutzomyia longipalpis TaxID=7200 RepID=UPI002483E60D|nr:prolactin-releasing peptide receptor-like [Lutzomyia longipalpis]XP_055694451.1 prolactin-releasing peptide receptor-like [Lutzomyia longipalpis]XP_055694452.1 prolactin-releasing peptide receptor-like [Lutzomyia longipalpis]XP_055694453.1 prolactin-releasing peptide receptor-like [Lutzomyia longipalpis]
MDLLDATQSLNDTHNSTWVGDVLLTPTSGSIADNTTEPFSLNATQTDIINNELVQATFCLLYTIIFILGVVGNILVCYVVFRNKAMQTVTNFFITNLALSDILLCVLAVPFTPLYTFLRRWVFGVALCHLVPFAQGCSVYISTLTLTAVAIDRFFVIMYPFQPRMKLSVCIWIIVTIWLFSILGTMPYGIFMRISMGKDDHNEDVSLCEEHWPSEQWRKVYGALTSLLQFAFPLVIITFCYVCVSIKLNDRAKSKPGSKTSKREEADRDRKKRTNRMLISMVAVFAISWLPLNLVNIYNDFYSMEEEWQFTTFLFFIAHSIAMSSTCYNPFLYAWLNENFRKEFKQLMPCFFGPNATLGGAIATASVVEGRNRGKWRPDPMRNSQCNGANSEAMQETLLPQRTTTRDASSCVNLSTSGTVVSSSTTTTAASSSTSSSPPPYSAVRHHDKTFLLPSGVLETHFEENPMTNNNNA